MGDWETWAHLLSWFLSWVSSCLNICKVKHTSGRDNLNTSKNCVSFKTLKEIKSHNFKEKIPSDIYLPQSWRKASISGVAIARATILEKGLGVKVAGWGQDVLKVSIHSGMMSKCMARLQTPFFWAGLLFVWRPIWLFFNYWPFYLNCGTTFNCSFYGTCHIPGLIAKFSILKCPIINDIIQPNMLNWILSLRTLISNTPENVKISEITCFQSHTLSFLVLQFGSPPTSLLALCVALASQLFLPLSSEWKRFPKRGRWPSAFSSHGVFRSTPPCSWLH